MYRLCILESSTNHLGFFFLSEKCKQDIAIAMFDMHDCTLEAKTKAITSESFCLRPFSHAGKSTLTIINAFLVPWFTECNDNPIIQWLLLSSLGGSVLVILITSRPIPYVSLVFMLVSAAKMKVTAKVVETKKSDEEWDFTTSVIAVCMIFFCWGDLHRFPSKIWRILARTDVFLIARSGRITKHRTEHLLCCTL